MVVIVVINLRLFLQNIRRILLKDKPWAKEIWARVWPKYFEYAVILDFL